MSTPRVAVLAADESGERLEPHRGRFPKVLVEVAGKALLTRQLELVRDELGLGTVFLVVGDGEESIRDFVRDGDLGLEIHFVRSAAPDRGLGATLLAIEPVLTEPFVFLPGSECYVGSNLRDLPRVEPPYDAVCGLLSTEDPEVAFTRPAANVTEDRVTGIGTRAEGSSSPFAACGAHVLTSAIFRFVHEAATSSSGRIELTAVLDRAARAGAVVKPFVVGGHCLAVDTVDDRKAANHLYRSLHFEHRRVSIVVPTFNEAASIGAVLRDFAPHVWEMVVVDNCSPDGTADIARRHGANVISRPTRGFGDAVKQGLDVARGDILVMVDADGTFRAKDLGKLLEFLKDADMVVGTRTTRGLIERGANMDGLLRLANVLWGKIIEVLWWNRETRFTDVGCTYRAFWREAYLGIRDRLVTEDAAFLPELVVEMMRGGRRVIEIPVNYYRRRAGESKYSGSLWRSARTGLEMLGLILRRRLGRR